jgi:hypothetical protein
MPNKSSFNNSPNKPKIIQKYNDSKIFRDVIDQLIEDKEFLNNYDQVVKKKEALEKNVENLEIKKSRLNSYGTEYLNIQKNLDEIAKLVNTFDSSKVKLLKDGEGDFFAKENMIEISKGIKILSDFYTEEEEKYIEHKRILDDKKNAISDLDKTYTDKETKLKESYTIQENNLIKDYEVKTDKQKSNYETIINNYEVRKERIERENHELEKKTHILKTDIKLREEIAWKWLYGVLIIVIVFAAIWLGVEIKAHFSDLLRYYYDGKPWYEILAFKITTIPFFVYIIYFMFSKIATPLIRSIYMWVEKREHLNEIVFIVNQMIEKSSIVYNYLDENENIDKNINDYRKELKIKLISDYFTNPSKQKEIETKEVRKVPMVSFLNFGVSIDKIKEIVEMMKK